MSLVAARGRQDGKLPNKARRLEAWDAGADGMTLYVREDDQPYYAVLIDTPAGVIVKLCSARMPKGRRVLDEMTFDAPLHHVANRVHALLADVNR